MIELQMVLMLVWFHFLGDFILQSDRVATGKSKSNLILLEHVSLYSLPFVMFGLYFAAVNLVLHFCVDWATSRLTSYLWAKEERHWFFVVIGADQALHMTCLLVTYLLILG